MEDALSCSYWIITARSILLLLMLLPLTCQFLRFAMRLPSWDRSNLLTCRCIHAIINVYLIQDKCPKGANGEAAGDVSSPADVDTENCLQLPDAGKKDPAVRRCELLVTSELAEVRTFIWSKVSFESVLISVTYFRWIINFSVLFFLFIMFCAFYIPTFCEERGT